MRVRNDSGKDIKITLFGREIDWKNGETIDLSDQEWNTIHGTGEFGEHASRVFWARQFDGKLPRLVPLKGRTTDNKEE